MQIPLPIDRLIDESAKKRSGEFIFANQGIEIHVFLLRGRVAWATDSTHPFEFARFLKKRCSIDDDVFRDVLEECRRARSPLGQTLVGWDLCTFDDVRAALRHQIVLALSGLVASLVGATMFLERDRFADYDEQLAFDLEELLESVERPSLAQFDPPESLGTIAAKDIINALKTAPPPADPDASDVAPTEADEEHGPSTARQLLDTIKGASWVKLQNGRSIQVATHGTSPSVSPGLAAATLDDGADFVALRSATGCVMGARLAPSESVLWCELSSDSTFRSAFAAISALGLSQSQSRPILGTTLDLVSWHLGELDTAWAHELEQVFGYGPAVLAVALVSKSGELIGGMGRTSFDVTACMNLTTRRMAAFSPSPASDSEMESLGFRFRTLATGEPNVWCFGAETFTGQPATLWVIVSRWASQGVGWACLTALLRGFRGANVITQSKESRS